MLLVGTLQYLRASGPDLGVAWGLGGLLGFGGRLSGFIIGLTIGSTIGLILGLIIGLMSGLGFGALDLVMGFVSVWDDRRRPSRLMSGSEAVGVVREGWGSGRMSAAACWCMKCRTVFAWTVNPFHVASFLCCFGLTACVRTNLACGIRCCHEAEGHHTSSSMAPEQSRWSVISHFGEKIRVFYAPG